MKTARLALLLPIGILCLTCTKALSKVPFEQHPFVAEYKLVLPMRLASSRLRIAYDGNEHARLEEFATRIAFLRLKDSHHISFLDYNTNTCRRLIPAEHRIASEILGDFASEYIFPKAVNTEYSRRTLGSRTIRGHHCHGWRYKIDDGSMQIWIDDELGIPVWIKDSPGKNAEWASGPFITRLVKYSSAASAEEFTLPPEYSEKEKLGSTARGNHQAVKRD